MERRSFLTGAAALSGAPALAQSAADKDGVERHSGLPAKFTPCAYATTKTGYSPFTVPDYYTFADDLSIERSVAAKPHSGKVLAAVQAHSDDIPLFASG